MNIPRNTADVLEFLVEAGSRFVVLKAVSPFTALAIPAAENSGAEGRDSLPEMEYVVRRGIRRCAAC